MTVFLFIIGAIVVLIGIGIFLKLAKDRQSTSIEASMRQFKRGLDALDPSNDPLARAREHSRGRRGSHDSDDDETGPRR